jgi:urease alpha subunit
MYGALGKAVGATSVAFMSQAAVVKGKAKEYGLEKEAVAVEGCRTVSKKVRYELSNRANIRDCLLLKADHRSFNVGWQTDFAFHPPSLDPRYLQCRSAFMPLLC